MVRELRGGGGSGGGGGQRREVGKGGGQNLGGGGSGGLGKGTTRTANNGNRGRPGDWTCDSCGAYPCFARAARCYLCHAPRAAGTGGPPQQRSGKGGEPLARIPTYLGPIGANGSRPLLGRRGADSQAASGQGRGQVPTAGASPTFRVPGASTAARAEQERRERGTHHQGSAQQSQQRSTEQEATAAAGTAATITTPLSTPPVASPVPPIQTANRWAALDEDGDDDEEGGDAANMDCDDDGDGGCGDAATGTEGEGQLDGETEPTPAELRRDWEKLCATYRRLEKEGGDVPPSVLAAVRTQREAAEKRWRAAKPLQPLHKRLRWAEAELKEAEARELARQRELEEHLAVAARRTAEIEQRLAVDRARTERKRSVLQGLQGREAVARCPASEAAARIALRGIADDIAPAIEAAMASLGEEPTATRQGLRHAAQALTGVQEVLREATAAAAESRQPTGFLGGALGIAHEGLGGGSTGGHGGHGGDGDGGDGANDQGLPGADGGRQGWTRVGPGGQWKKARTSEAAAEEARRVLHAQGGKLSLGPNGLPPATAEERTNGGAAGGLGGDDGCNDATRTNDLGEATRRAERAAQRQIQEAAERQQQHKDPRQLQEEETARQQRAQQQQLELQKHQAAVEMAAAARAAEERRQREELVARMSPEDLARAAEAHAQQLAVGAHAFGSQPASHIAGLVHQSRVQGAVQEAERNGGDADAEFLMSLSPEEFAQWDHDRQGRDNGACPW